MYMYTFVHILFLITQKEQKKNMSTVVLSYIFSSSLLSLSLFSFLQHGQLGNGGEYKSLEKAGKWTYQMTKRPERVVGGDTLGIKLIDVKSGPNHSCALSEDGKIYTWGFGGYGR